LGVVYGEVAAGEEDSGCGCCGHAGDVGSSGSQGPG
jgi:hypothetical protein